MKLASILYLILLIGCLGMAACQDVTVGYLRTDHAKYSVDTLHIGAESVYVKIREMEITYPPLKDYVEAEKLIAELEPKIERLYQELEGLDEVQDYDRIDEIYALLDELEPQLDDAYNDSFDAQDVFYDDMGIGYREMEIIRDQYLALFSTIELGLPWTTAMIEGVLGTQPIAYSIAGITAEDGGDAAILEKELVMYGGGRMQLSFDCKAPKGTYHVSILVENEGYSNHLDNIFTFIVD